MSEQKVCKICQSVFIEKYTFREMMFGTRDEFLHYECSGCGCLQIAEIPVNIEKYYPPYYYSFIWFARDCSAAFCKEKKNVN